MEHTFSANGNSPEFQARERVHVSVSGTFGSGTATVQWRGDDGTWRGLASAVFTTAADQVIDLPNKTNTILRWNLAGATDPSVFAAIR